MSYRGPRDRALHQRWRQERRAIARAHHPDKGGNTGDYVRRLGELDDRFRAADARNAQMENSWRWPVPHLPVTTTIRWTRRGARFAVRRIRYVRSKVPAGWPGARRYTDI